VTNLNESDNSRHEMLTPGDDMPFSNVVLLRDMEVSGLGRTGATFGALYLPKAVTSIFENHVDAYEFSAQLKEQYTGIVPFGYVGGLPTTGTLIRIFSNAISLYLHGFSDPVWSPYLGTAHAAMYIYSHGQFNVNGQMQSIFDGLTIFSARPYRGRNMFVSTFTGKMHCNIQGHTYLGSTRLPSGNTGGTVGVSISGTGPSISFSYSFNPNGINITDSSPTLRVVEWRMSTPFFYFHQPGRIRDIAPAMRMASPNHVGARGIFSSFIVPRNGFSDGGPGGGIGNFPAEFSVGEWF